MRRNPALTKLRAGGMTSGISVGLDSPDLAELAAHAGFDYVWLEWQHGQVLGAHAEQCHCPLSARGNRSPSCA